MAPTNRAARSALQASSSSSAVSLPDRLASVLQETRWILFIAVGGYLALALFGFNVADPGWSHAATVDAIKVWQATLASG